MILDESHNMIPQLGAMYAGDKSRKTTLVEYGFRLPSALDNRPLQFDEFKSLMPQTIFVSATPGPYELENGGTPIDQVVRPTGLLVVTTLTKRMSEDLTDYLTDHGVKVRYLHSDIDTVERVEILRDLRLGEFDVLVGINLLREGLDLPEVSLVAILDADREGFLRSTRSLIQTIGRAARNLEGRAILYADKITGSMKYAIDETNRRRQRQEEHNKAEGITPQGVKKAIKDIIDGVGGRGKGGTKVHRVEMKKKSRIKDPGEFAKYVSGLEKEMFACADNMEF